MTAATTTRSFEHFRAPKTPGLGGLGKIGTCLLIFAAMIGIALVILVNFVVGVVWGAFAGLLLMSIATRDRHGLSYLERFSVSTAHARARRTGSAEYHSGPTTRLGTYKLPGVLAETELTEWEINTGEPFALVRTPRPGHYAVTIECHPDGASLVDDDDASNQVDRWGEFLSFLAFEPSLIQAMVTVGTSPDDGSGLRTEIGIVNPAAPPLATRVMREVLETYPAGSAAVRSWLTLTFAPPRKTTPDEMGSALAHRLPSILGKLSGTGAGQATLVDAEALAQVIRVAYDPDAARHYTRAVPTVTRWESVGPVAAVNSWDHYRHSGAVSASWSMSDVMGRVHSEGLGPLLRPHPGIAHKRVSLIFTPHDPARSQRIASVDLKAAEYRATSVRKPSATDRKDLASAEITATEEAHGNALVDVAVIVTATVAGVDDLPAVEAAMDAIGPAARLLLRREDGGHAAAFAQGLPGIGLVTAAHSVVPRPLRESL